MRKFSLLLATTLAASLAVSVIAACGHQVELDPRDEEAAEMNTCNRRSTEVTLVVKNRSTFDVEITIITRSGSRRKLIPYASYGTSEYKLSRFYLNSGGAFIVVPIRGGMNMYGNGHAQMTPLACAVGTLEINGTMNQIYYIGAEW